MGRAEAEAKLSELQTQTTLMIQANQGSPEQVDAALQLLMLRYSGAVHRYLLKAVGDPEAAKELNQEFSLKFLRGDFRSFDPSRGRFRDYLKRSVHNLMMDHYRDRPRLARLDTRADVEEDPGRSAMRVFEEDFLKSWRQDLMTRAWNALKEFEARTGQPYWEVLRLRVARPDLRSPELAAVLEQKLGRPITPGGLRQTLVRARDKFTEFLVVEVRVSLKNPTRDAVEEELGDLRLLEFCKSSLARMDFDGQAAG